MKTFNPPNILFGITMCVAAVSTLVFYTSASKIEKLGGPLNTMGFAMLLGTVRFGANGFTPFVYLITVVQVIT